MSYRNSTRAGRVSNREIRRRAKGSFRESTKLFALFLTVLAQKGGEVTITQGTIDQVGERLMGLGYVVVPGKNEKEFIVRITEGDEKDGI
jgi:hypothetical protein